MKKKDLVLDFTSLLDVILIILFVVIANMSQVSSATVNEANASVSELQVQNNALADELELTKNQFKKQQDFQKEFEDLQDKYNTLMDEFEYLKITTDYDPNDISVYETAIKRTSKVLLECKSLSRKSSTSTEVDINIYLNNYESTSSTYMDTMTLVHDFSLSKSQRASLVAQQTIDLTKILSSVLRNTENDIFWFTVQYDYIDENISNSDLEIIKSAIDNFEQNFSKSCLYEEIKIF